VRELVGGGRNLGADDVEHKGRIQEPEFRIQKGFGRRFTQMKHRQGKYFYPQMTQISADFILSA
jgi:hypothetical protein